MAVFTRNRHRLLSWARLFQSTLSIPIYCVALNIPAFNFIYRVFEYFIAQQKKRFLSTFEASSLCICETVHLL
jgi:hypothetical protein